MKAYWTEEQGIWTFRIFVSLFAFFIPISPSLKSIFMGLSLAAIIVSPYYIRRLGTSFRMNYAIIGMALFILVMASCAWSPAAWGLKLGVVEKYSKLLYLPVLAIGFMNARTRVWGLNAFLLAMLLTVMASLYKYWIANIPESDPGEVFHNHIVTSFMVAFASYAALELRALSHGWVRYLYLLMFALMTYQLFFINTGRTGYFIYGILMGFFILTHCSWRQTIVGLLVIFSSYALLYQYSTFMNLGMHSLVSDWHGIRHDQKNTSLGYRLQFHQYAKHLLLQHPILGVGAGGFRTHFHHDDPVPSWGRHIVEPHSQYWFLLAEQGMVGLLLFLGFLLALYQNIRKSRTYHLLASGFLVAFGFYCLSDTVFAYSAVGYLLLIIMGVGLGDVLEQKPSLEGSDAHQK